MKRACAARSKPRAARARMRCRLAPRHEAKERLRSLRKFRFGTQTPFAQASYVEMPK